MKRLLKLYDEKDFHPIGTIDLADIAGGDTPAVLADVAISGSYEDLNHKPTIPTIPTKVSEFTNDADYATKAEVKKAIEDAEPTIPTKVSELANDAKYQTETQVRDAISASIPSVPTKVSQLTNDANYQTDADVQETLDGKYDKSGGTINGDVKVDGKLTLGIEDEDYDTGIHFNASIDDNIGTILSLAGYADNTAYKPILRNIAEPRSNNDAANKEYVDTHLLVPTFHLVELDIDGSVVQSASSIRYKTLQSNLTNPLKKDYLDVIWRNVGETESFSRYYLPCVGINEVNNGNLIFCNVIVHNNKELLVVIELDNQNILSSATIEFEKLSRKVASIVANPNNNDYPTTSAVNNEFVRKSEVVYEATGDGIQSANTNFSQNPSWQLTGLDLSKYKRLKFYVAPGKSTGGITPSVVLECSLDNRAASADTYNYYTASTVCQFGDNDNRLYALFVVVSDDKTKVFFSRQSSIYGTAATNASGNNRNLYKIEGYFD